MKNFKSFMLTIVGIFAIIVCASMFTACSQDDYLPEIKDSEVNYVGLQPKTRALSDISPGVYNIDSIYKSSYVHYQQGAVGCGPLNYVLCMRAIIRGNNPSATYASNIYAKWQDVITYAGYTAQTTSDLFDYWYDNDQGWGVYAYEAPYQSHNDAGKQAITESMIYQFADNHKPFLFLGATSSGAGHYYIVWNITWTGNLNTSTIYVTDTTDPVKPSFNQQLKSYNLNSFLEMAKTNPLANNYRILCFY